MMHTLKKKLHDVKLPQKMIYIYTLFAIIFWLVDIISLQYGFEIYDEKLYEGSMQELNFYSEKVDEDIQDIMDFSYNIAMDSDIQDQLASLEDLSIYDSEYSYQMYEFRMMLINTLNNNDFAKSIAYTDRRKTLFEVGTSTGDINGSIYTTFMEKVHQNKGGVVLQSPTSDYKYLLIGRDILKTRDATLDYLGTLVVACDVQGIIEDKLNLIVKNQSILFVYSEDGMIYQGSDEVPDLSDVEGTDGYQIVRYQNKKYFLCYHQSDFNGWTYVNLFPYSDIYGKTAAIKTFLFAVFILLFFLTICTMKRIAYSVTRPLKNLSDSMKIVEKGEFEKARNMLPGETYEDEVGVLICEFKYMLEEINTLIYTNYEKQILLTETKYKMLQAQINPHFLYNTLNTIHWMVKAGNQEETGKMIVDLGDLLRYSLHKNQFASVAEEIEATKSYLAIQQFRYKKRAEFDLKWDGNLTNYKIPRMILQPLIENAINYGIDQKSGICNVNIMVTEKEDVICMIVEDSGVGMNEETLEKVRNFTVVPKGHGIGLKNIYERLSITFQKQFTFTVDSIFGMGTKIQIEIPKVKRGEENV